MFYDLLKLLIIAKLQDRIHKLETLLQQQNEFIEQHEKEIAKGTAHKARADQLEQRVQKIEDSHRDALEEKDIQIEDLYRQLNFKK